MRAMSYFLRAIKTKESEIENILRNFDILRTAFVRGFNIVRTKNQNSSYDSSYQTLSEKKKKKKRRENLRYWI